EHSDRRGTTSLGGSPQILILTLSRATIMVGGESAVTWIEPLLRAESKVGAPPITMEVTSFAGSSPLRLRRWDAVRCWIPFKLVIPRVVPLSSATDLYSGFVTSQKRGR